MRIYKRVIQAFGGDIRCRSVVGEYTEFILSFPPEVSAQTWQDYQNTMITRIRPLLVGKRVLVVVMMMRRYDPPRKREFR